MNNGNNIYYGHHLFPGIPELYIRENEYKDTKQEVHENIKQALIAGFSSQNPDSIFSEAHENIKQALIAGFSSQNPDSIFSQVAERFDLTKQDDVILSFMNYGNTELVYLAAIGGKVKLATLINQPHTTMGKVQKEFIYLQRLAQIDPFHVVKPFAYYSPNNGTHEMYATEYIENALCVAHLDGHGIYNPLPQYHFETFSKEMSSNIKTNIISLLVNYYDQEQGEGLAKTEISGSDFLLTRNFNHQDPGTIQDNIKIIGARDAIKTTLDGYLNIIREEFTRGTHRNGKESVNYRSEESMTPEEIERGIELGLLLRKKQK